MRLQSRIPAAYSITSKFIEPEDPKHTHDAIGMMDLLMGKLSEMFRQFGMSDDPPAATSRAVQPDLRTTVRITRDTCYADSPGNLTAIKTERYQDMSDSEMSTYKHAAV